MKELNGADLPLACVLTLERLSRQWGRVAGHANEQPDSVSRPEDILREFPVPLDSVKDLWG